LDGEGKSPPTNYNLTSFNAQSINSLESCLENNIEQVGQKRYWLLVFITFARRLFNQTVNDLVKCLVFVSKFGKLIPSDSGNSNTSNLFQFGFHLLDNFCIKDISNTITFDSIMREKDTQIYAIIASSDSWARNEILAKFPEKQHQTIMRGVSRLMEEGLVKHEKIRGKGKRPRYFVTEENTKNKLLIRAIEGNKKNYKIIKAPITQRNLSQLITQSTKFYRKEIVMRNFKDMQDFIFYHLAKSTHCLRWISQITWAIHSGMLGDSQSNITLAYRNRARYEEFLQQIIYNLKEADPKAMKAITQAIYHILVDNPVIDELTVSSGKGKVFLQLNKGQKFKVYP